MTTLKNIIFHYPHRMVFGAGSLQQMAEDYLALGYRRLFIISPFLVPDSVYIDPALTVSLPASVTAYTGIDALTHCIEAYANRFAHPMVDTPALEGIRLICRNLKKAVEDGQDLEARSRVAMGAASGAPDAETALQGVALIRQLIRDCQVPSQLSALDIPSEANPEMAHSAMEIQRLLKNKVREVTLDDAMTIYQTSD